MFAHYGMSFHAKVERGGLILLLQICLPPKLAPYRLASRRQIYHLAWNYTVKLNTAHSLYLHSIQVTGWITWGTVFSAVPLRKLLFVFYINTCIIIRGEDKKDHFHSIRQFVFSRNIYYWKYTKSTLNKGPNCVRPRKSIIEDYKYIMIKPSTPITVLVLVNT